MFERSSEQYLPGQLVSHMHKIQHRILQLQLHSMQMVQKRKQRKEKVSRMSTAKAKKIDG
jgi:hypothetical protein